jgi:uncharacterized integral membrane protein
MLRALVVLLLILELVATGLYALQNQALMTVNFLTWNWADTPTWAPTSAALLVMLVTCILYGMASGVRWRMRHRRMARDVDTHTATVEQLQRENAELHEELAGLRSRREAPNTPETSAEPTDR